MSSSADGLCMCTGDTKCPHGISSKLPVIFDDIEKSIDTILAQFDRRAVKKYLKNDNVPEKGKLTRGLDETYGQQILSTEPIVDPKLKEKQGGLNNTNKSNNRQNTQQIMSASPGHSESKRPDVLKNSNSGINFNNFTNNNNNNNMNMNSRPNTSAGPGAALGSNLSARPGTSGGALQTSNEVSKTLKHSNSGPPTMFATITNSMSQSTPLLPKVITGKSKSSHQLLGGEGDMNNNNSNNNNSSSGPIQSREAWGHDAGDNTQLAAIVNPSDKLSSLPSATNRSNSAFETSIFPSTGKNSKTIDHYMMNDSADFNNVMMDTLGRKVGDAGNDDAVREGEILFVKFIFTCINIRLDFCNDHEINYYIYIIFIFAFIISK
jgi:hypothetical protein